MTTPSDDVEVSRLVDAPPARIWELIGDPTRIGEISPECGRIRWIGGASAPAPGAKFVGYNRKGFLRWTTTSTVAEVEPERTISWDVAVLGQAVARWAFRLVPEGDRTRVVQTWQDHRTPLANLIGRVRTTDSATHNRAGMEQTLEAVRRKVEH